MCGVLTGKEMTTIPILFYIFMPHPCIFTFFTTYFLLFPIVYVLVVFLSPPCLPTEHDLIILSFTSLPRFKHTREIKGFAFVEFVAKDEARAAVEVGEGICFKFHAKQLGCFALST